MNKYTNYEEVASVLYELNVDISSFIRKFGIREKYETKPVMHWIYTLTGRKEYKV